MRSTHQFWRTKTVEQTLAVADRPGNRLSRSLTAWDLTALGVGVTIGTGIFTVTATTAGTMAGPAVSLAFLLAVVACGLAALCYAEFASTVPVAGSAYTYAYATTGELLAWIIGWDLLLEFALGTAIVAKGWAFYFADLVGLESTSTTVGSLPVDVGAMVFVLLITAMVSLGAKVSARVSLVMTLVKVGVILLVIVVGAFHVRASNWFPFLPPAEPATAGASAVDQSVFAWLTGAGGSSFGWYGLLAAASLLFFAFLGFDAVSSTAEEVRNPQRTLPVGILASLAVVTVLYTAVSLVLTGMVDYRELGAEGSTLATAFTLNGITWAGTVVNVGAVMGLSTILLVYVMGLSRILLAMSRDGLLPGALSRVGRRGTPARSTLIAGGVVALLAGFFPIVQLQEMVNIGALFAFVLVCTGVVVLRRTRPELPRGFRVPWVPVVPVLGVLACVWLMLNLPIGTWLRFAVWLVLGAVVYAVYGRKRSVLARAHQNLSGLDAPSEETRRESAVDPL